MAGTTQRKAGKKVEKVYFTRAERTVKNCTLAGAVRAAQAILDGMHAPNYKPKNKKGFAPVEDGWCAVRMNRVMHKWLGEKITIVQLNQIADQLVKDTLEYVYDVKPESDEPVA